MLKIKYHQIMYVINSFLYGEHSSEVNKHYVQIIRILVRKELKRDISHESKTTT